MMQEGSGSANTAYRDLSLSASTTLWGRPTDRAIRSNPMSSEDTVLVIRVFFDISSSANTQSAQTSLFKSFKLTEDITFKELFKTICDRMGISDARSVYYKLTLRWFSLTNSQRLDYDPPMHSKVVCALYQIGHTHFGSVALYFIDSRLPRHRRIDVPTQAALSLQAPAPTVLTSFAKRNLAVEFFGKYEQGESLVLPYALLHELEAITVKRARLMKLMRIKEGVWRYTLMYMHIIYDISL
jgi:hypothetical protein